MSSGMLVQNQLVVKGFSGRKPCFEPIGHLCLGMSLSSSIGEARTWTEFVLLGGTDEERKR